MGVGRGGKGQSQGQADPEGVMKWELWEGRTDRPTDRALPCRVPRAQHGAEHR